MNNISTLESWTVLLSVRGIQTQKNSTTIGRSRFYKLDEKAFELWGQRLAMRQKNPPTNSPLDRFWVDENKMIFGQTVAETTVLACDSDHARQEALRTITESLDLIRYGQIIFGWPPNPVPELGLTAISEFEYVENHSVCINSGNFEMSIKKEVGAGDGAIIDNCKEAPAWKSLEKILLIDPIDRTEIHKRIILALAWVGQAALASSAAVQLVAITTALETLLIEDSESLGKKTKLSSRVAAFPKMKLANKQIGIEDIKTVYGTRSNCLHAGSNDVTSEDINLASMGVAQCFSGILEDPIISNLESLGEILDHLKDQK